VQPFANSVVTMTLTGAQVREVLEQQWQPAGSSRPFLALGVPKGFFFTYDDAAPAGQHVKSVTLDGAELDATAQYRVTVNSFLASGGDNFTTLAEGTDRVELGKTDLEAFTAYLGLPENARLAPDQEPRSAVATEISTPVVESPAPTPTAPAVAVPTPSATTSKPAVAAGAEQDLATTGADIAPWIAAGAALVLAGGLLITAAARRRDV
jgi:5'-nucleotidase